MNHKVLAVIPARLRSSRFPEKVIQPLLSKPLVQYVYAAAKFSAVIDRVIIAVDDVRVKEVAEGFGAEVWMTSTEHFSGTDRVFEVAKQLEYSIIVNLQADEPLIKPEMITKLTAALIKEKNPALMSTLVTGAKQEEINNPDTVKVVVDKNKDAMYFSRLPIPWENSKNGQHNSLRLKHIGLYGYQFNVLKKLASFSPSSLETAEKLEQLRALENGIKIHTVFLENAQLIGVDTEANLKEVETYLKNL